MIDPILKALAFDVRIFLFQIVLFVSLLVVMNAIFWKPMLAHLKSRDDYRDDVYRRIEGFETEMESLKAEYGKRITDLEAEARSHIQAAIKEAQTERERLLAEAREASAQSIAQGVADMEREKTESLHTLRERMIGIATTAADRALGSTVDTDTLRQRVEANIKAA